ncbi:hypothetical protein FJV76_14255 [Mesorhizobium sp. WSM4303]|uniref:hypothetical protein n=1 Tax=Mesorhizobium sp. WSM4303 TaxID=2589887 RepID=UPI00115E8F75|nr:hypothetical protein [Mesorhizobium sp. WSM4303]TRD03796.1 hypothetical protein FJV76_14255 [Mesorhizobium sp. WSM4303]
MATFQITAPNGKKYRITGDDPSGAMAALHKMIGADAPLSSVKVDPTTNQPEGVPAFNPGVEGYDPQSGEVVRGKADSAMMGAADTTSFGFGDEAAAGLGTLIDKLPGGQGASYGQNLAEIRGNQADAQRDNPKSYLGGQIGGGIAQGLVAGPGVLANAPTTLGRALGGAVTGAGFGGLYGLGSGEDTEGRAIEGAKGAGLGALVGGAFPFVAKGASSAYSAIANALSGKAAASAAGTTPEVLRMLGNVLDSDGTRSPVGQANMAKAGADAMLADAGPNAKAILDTAIQRGGPGAVAARDAIAARTGRASSAIADALDNTLGSPEGVTAARTAIREGSAPARSAAYKAAYEAPIDYSAEGGRAIEDIVKTRVPQSAIAEANALMRAEGNSSKQILAKVADDGSVTFEKLPDVRQLDYITRGLNEVADQADGAGKLGGTTAKGRAYSQLSQELRGHLKDLVPEYGKALETAADPIRRSKAVELGSKLFSSATTRDQVDEAVRGMTQAERDAVGQGVRSRLDDAMANVTRTVQDGDTPAREAIKALKDLSSRANREKLEAVVGKTKAGSLFSEVDRAAQSFDLRASVTENSKTFARQATAAKVSQMTEPGAIGQALQGKPLKAGQRIAQALTGQTPENITAKQDAVYSQLADILTRPQGQAQQVFQALQGLGKTDKATEMMAGRILRALGGPHLAYPSSVLLGKQLPSR